MNGSLNRTVLDRVLMAINEQSERVNQCEYGEVLVKIQGGIPVLVNVSESYKPTLGHRVTALKRLEGTEEYLVACECGWQGTSPTRLSARSMLEAHIQHNR